MYGPIRTTNGALRVNEPFSGAPMRWSACFASMALAYGPVVIVDCVEDLLVTTKDIPRAIVL